MIVNFGLIIILLLIIVGGIIAYIGDYIGRSIGRKRLSFLKLRPRYTAIFFTIVTGVLIVFLTLTTLLIISQDVRTALFGLTRLKNTLKTQEQLIKKNQEELNSKAAEKAALDKQLEETKSQIATLKKSKVNLEKEIKLSRKGSLLFNVNDILTTSVIMAGPEKDKLETGLRQILSATELYIKSLGVENKGQLAAMEPHKFNQTVNLLQEKTGEHIIEVVVNQNTLWGEPASIHFNVKENKLLYKNNEEIAEVSIPANLSAPEIEQLIKKLLANTHAKGKKEGVVPGPDGSIGSVPYSDIFNLAKKIEAYKKSVLLKSTAKGDIYSVGPLVVDFKVYYQ